MKARSVTEPWVISLRTSLTNSVGNSWQVIEQKKGRTALAIQLNDGSMTFKYLGIDWQEANSGKIREAVESIYKLVNSKKLPLEKAVDQVKGTCSTASKTTNRRKQKLLIGAWEGYEFYKVKVSSEITQKTWDNEYRKTFRWLKQVAAVDANDLFIDIGKTYEAGSRSRQVRVQHMAAFLRWATSKASGHLLPADKWTPPLKDSLQKFIGSKPARKQQEHSTPIVAIEDEDLLELVDSLPIDLDMTEKKHRLRDRAMEWDLAIKLAVVYGLRPIEVSFDYLEVKKKGKEEYLFCTYCKKTGSGIIRPRRLRPLHPEWEKKWNLLQRVNRNDALPRMKDDAGEVFKNYLRFNAIWQKLKVELGVVPYSFRHSYSRRGHQVYKLSDSEMSALMGQTVEAHQVTYAQWNLEAMVEIRSNNQ